MKKSILYIICLLFTTQTNLIAQTTNSTRSDASEKEVKQVIQNMFHAMLQADTTLLRTCFSDKVIFQTIVNKPEGAMVNTMPINNSALQNQRITASGRKCKIHMQIFS